MQFVKAQLVYSTLSCQSFGRAWAHRAVNVRGVCRPWSGPLALQTLPPCTAPDTHTHTHKHTHTNTRYSVTHAAASAAVAAVATELFPFTPHSSFMREFYLLTGTLFFSCSELSCQPGDERRKEKERGGEERRGEGEGDREGERDEREGWGGDAPCF